MSKKIHQELPLVQHVKEAQTMAWYKKGRLIKAAGKDSAGYQYTLAEPRVNTSLQNSSQNKHRPRCYPRACLKVNTSMIAGQSSREMSMETHLTQMCAAGSNGTVATGLGAVSQNSMPYRLRAGGLSLATGARYWQVIKG